jgi:hypothetical protein
LTPTASPAASPPSAAQRQSRSSSARKQQYAAQSTAIIDGKSAIAVSPRNCGITCSV